MSGTAINGSGVGLSGRATTPIYNRTNRTYRTSAFYAELMELSGGELEFSQFTQNTVVPVLLYLNDYPAVLRGESRYNDVTHNGGIAFPAGIIHINEDCAHAPRVDVAPFTQVLTTTQTVVEAGGLVRGTTPTNGVETFGYMAHINVRLTDFEAGAPENLSLPRVLLQAHANAAVVDCPAVSGGGVAVGPSFPLLAPFAVLMRESSYTQAMRDAGDVFVDPNGITVHIVGLHDVSAVEIPS